MTFIGFVAAAPKLAWRKSKRAFDMIFDVVCDRVRRVDTAPGRLDIDADWKTERVDYEPIPYRALKTIDKHLPLDPSDVVYDLGCGKGRVVMHFSTKRARRVIGVEYDRALVDIANLNLSANRKYDSTTSIVHGDAADQDYSDLTVLFMYNPFGPNTINAVLKKIVGRPNIRIFYANPVHEQSFLSHPKIDLVERLYLPYKGGKVPAILMRTI